MSSYIQGFLQDAGIDYAVDKWNEVAEEKFQPTKDPYYVKLPDGSQKRRKLPDYCTRKEKKLWKKLQNRAWKDDRCLCGCIWVNWGLGLAPILSIIPTIGPLVMYYIHSKLIDMANKELDLPADVMVKLHGNIVFDLLITLPPILGTLLAWLNACSTRNCAIIYNFMVKRASKRQEGPKVYQPPDVYHQETPNPPVMRQNGGSSPAVYHQELPTPPVMHQNGRPPPPSPSMTAYPSSRRNRPLPPSPVS